MSSRVAPSQHFRIGPWLVDPEQNLLRSDDVERHLLPRSMRMLEYLAQRHRIVVHSDELIAALWGERFVGENPLYKHVALLRQALKLPHRGERYIQTVPKKGYRLVADVAFPDDYRLSVSHGVPTWQRGSPFRGLYSFEFEHSEVFFGRDRMAKIVVDALEENAQRGTAFVLLLGGSGTGKSSLVNAGVMPRLYKSNDSDPRREWYRCCFKPSDSPHDLVGGLAQAVAQSGYAVSNISDTKETLLSLFRTTERSAGGFFLNFLPRPRSEHACLVLFVDQMEELFTLNAVSKAEREQFVSAIDLLSTSGAIRVIAAMRNDYYPQCAQVANLVDLRRRAAQIDVEAPTPDEIGQMIRMPARAASLEFEEDGETNVRLDDLLRDAAISNPASLPLLQFALDALYENRAGDGLLTLRAYADLGGLAGAIARRAEETYQRLSDSAQASLPRLFNALVEIDATNGSRTKAHYRWQGDDSSVTELIEEFVDSRLFVSDLDERGRRVVRLAHEALIVHWPRLHDWLEENEEMLRIRNRLRSAAKRWQQEGGRRDLLLPAGRRLEEAESLRAADYIDLDVLVEDYLHRSKVRASRGRWLRGFAVATIAGTAFIATAAALVAISARNDARMQQAQAEGLLAFMVGDLRERLVPLGRLDVLDAVGDKALSYFAALDSETLKASSLANQAKVLEQIGQVRLAQGSTIEALDAFEHSLRVSRNLSDRHVDDVRALLSIGNAHYWVGFANWKLGRLHQTELHWLAYYESSKALTRVDRYNESWQTELSYAYNNLGTLALSQGNHDRALDMFSRSISVKESILNRNPANETVRVELADSLSWRGSALFSDGRLSEAGDAYERMLAALNELVSAYPRNAGHRYRLVLAHQHIGKLGILVGELDDALEHLTQAEGIVAELLHIDATNTTWQRGQAYVYTKQGQVFAAMHKTDVAAARFDAARDILDRLVNLDSANREWRLLRASNELSRAQLLIDIGRDGDAVAIAKATVKKLETDWAGSDLSSAERQWLIRAHLLARDANRRPAGLYVDPHLIAASAVVEKVPQPMTNPLDIAVAYDVAMAVGDAISAGTLASRLYDMGYREPRFVNQCRRQPSCPVQIATQ